MLKANKMNLLWYLTDFQCVVLLSHCKDLIQYRQKLQWNEVKDGAGDAVSLKWTDSLDHEKYRCSQTHCASQWGNLQPCVLPVLIDCFHGVSWCTFRHETEKCNISQVTEWHWLRKLFNAAVTDKITCHKGIWFPLYDDFSIQDWMWAAKQLYWRFSG